MLRVFVVSLVLVGGVWTSNSRGAEQSGQIAGKAWDETGNAWPYYAKACKLYVELPDEVEVTDLYPWPGDLSTDKRPLVAKWLEDNAEAIAQLTQGARQASYRHDLEYTNINHLKPIRDLTLGLLWRAKTIDLDDADATQPEKDLVVCCRVSSHLRQGPHVIEHLAGVALLAQMSRTSLMIVAHAGADPALVARLRTSIRGERSPTSDSEFQWLERERLWARANIQSLFEGTRDDSKMREDEAVHFAVLFDYTADQMEAFDLRRGKTLEDLDNGYAYGAEFLSLLPWQAHQQRLDFRQGFASRTRQNPLARRIMFNVPTTARLRAQMRAEWGALPCCLTVWQYKHDTGEFPPDLLTLMSRSYLNELPIDPYSGQPLVYRRTPDGFTLYSLGQDFDDDGGRHRPWGKEPDDGDYVFWPVQDQPAMAK